MDTLQKVVKDLKEFTFNCRPREVYAWLLGSIKWYEAKVDDFVYDPTGRSSYHVEPDLNLLVKSYELKKRLKPREKLDLIGWFHSHPIDTISITDIETQERYQKLYGEFFGCAINYNNLSLQCFRCEGGKVIFIPYEVI